MKILNIVGARPNFMKMAPIIEALNASSDRFEHLLVHTGQHYDQSMSQAFFTDLGMPKPNIDLNVGSGSHAEQTAKIMVAFEQVCLREQPDLVIVVGDVNSTMACTITAKKLGIQVAHVEAGLRSRDMQMPEEINRLCTDVLADYLFTTDHFANENLLQEGIPKEKIHFVGNVMIDTLLNQLPKAKALSFSGEWGLEKKEYATLTLHRPSNVDDKETLEGILSALFEISKGIPIVFPVHPRTKKMIERFDLGHFFEKDPDKKGIILTSPLGYLAFLHLNMNAKLVFTDSGGLQEETTVLGVPCITMRDNTERPITCEIGTNVMVGNNPTHILSAASRILRKDDIQFQIPEKWDGHAAQRIVACLEEK